MSMESVEIIRGHLAQLLEMPVDAIGDDLVLADQQNWDSLTIVTLVAILIEQGHGAPEPGMLDGVVTFRDLAQIATLH